MFSSHINNIGYGREVIWDSWNFDLVSSYVLPRPDPSSKYSCDNVTFKERYRGIKEGFDLCCEIIPFPMEPLFLPVYVCLRSDALGSSFSHIQEVTQESRLLGTWHSCHNSFCMIVKRVLKYDTRSLDASKKFPILNAREILSALILSSPAIWCGIIMEHFSWCILKPKKRSK